MGLGVSGTYTEDNWRTGNKEIWGRGMCDDWTGKTKTHEAVKICMSSVNAHQTSRNSAEKNFNNKEAKSAPFIGYQSASFPSHLCGFPTGL